MGQSLGNKSLEEDMCILRVSYMQTGAATEGYNLSYSEHLRKDDKSHIFKQLQFISTCFDSYSSFSFKITYKANSKFDLTIKEFLHINWRKL